jgi:CRP-like cAMP-binding protein
LILNVVHFKLNILNHHPIMAPHLDYLQKHDLERLFKELMQAILEAQPEDPVQFIIDGLYSVRNFTSSFDALAENFSYLPLLLETHNTMTSASNNAPPGNLSSFARGRRASVSAESYQPSEVDSAHFIVIPKSPTSVSRIQEAVKNNLLFNNLDLQQRQRIIDAMFERRIIAGEVVIRQGDEGDNFYVVDSGKFAVHVDGKPEPVVEIGPGGTFGELALMYNTPRTASVVALTDGLLWAVDRVTFRRVIIDIAFRKRRMYESFLRNVPLLETLEHSEICRIADALEPVSYATGSSVIVQGQPGDCFYIIVEGDADVLVNGSCVNHLGPGDYFGEVALLHNAPRAATVVAKTELQCVALEAAAFRRLLGPLTELLKRNEEKYQQYRLEQSS